MTNDIITFAQAVNNWTEHGVEYLCECEYLWVAQRPWSDTIFIEQHIVSIGRKTNIFYYDNNQAIEDYREQQEKRYYSNAEIELYHTTWIFPAPYISDAIIWELRNAK